MNEHRYTETRIAGFKDLTMLALTGIVCRNLGLGERDIPAIAYMHESESGKSCHVDDVAVRGVLLPEERKVLLRADLCSVDMIETLAHEIRHLYQVVKHGLKAGVATSDLAAYRASPWERDAVTYGESWSERIPVPRDAELASGFGAPEDTADWRRIKRDLGYRTSLYYLDLKEQNLYYFKDEYDHWPWRLSGRSVQLYN